MAAEAATRWKADRGTPTPTRMRFGVYYYDEPQDQSGTEEAP